MLLVMAVTAPSQAADFTLRDYLGHTWTNERVTFPLTSEQAAKAAQKQALVGPGDQQIPYQLLEAVDQDHARISFQVDLSPMESRAYRFSEQPADTKTDLKVSESDAELRIENELVGLAIRKTLQDGQGPIAGMRLRSGTWTGDSSLAWTSGVKSYSAKITARGAVFIEVLCVVNFKDEGYWSLRFRIERGEPVVLVEESFDAPGGGTFGVSPGGEAYQPTHVLYRSGTGDNLGKVNSDFIGSGAVYLLEPWLHWWEHDRQGNWFALYSPIHLPIPLPIC